MFIDWSLTLQKVAINKALFWRGLKILFYTFLIS